MDLIKQVLQLSSSSRFGNNRFQKTQTVSCIERWRFPVDLDSTPCGDDVLFCYRIIATLSKVLKIQSYTVSLPQRSTLKVNAVVFARLDNLSNLQSTQSLIHFSGRKFCPRNQCPLGPRIVVIPKTFGLAPDQIRTNATFSNRNDSTVEGSVGPH